MGSLYIHKSAISFVGRNATAETLIDSVSVLFLFFQSLKMGLAITIFASFTKKNMVLGVKQKGGR